MGYFPKLRLILPILLSAPAAHADGDTQPIGRFAIDRTVVPVGAVRRFVSATGMVTMAERQGGGSVFEAGWVRKPGWTWSTPFGEPADEQEPVVHITFDEAQAYLTADNQAERAATIRMRERHWGRTVGRA